MKAVRIETLQWLVGAFCAVIGTLMLVAPHQFALAAYAALKPHMLLWGTFFLLGGVSLVIVAALRPRRAVAVLAHVCAALALMSLSGGFVATSHLPGISNYAMLALGTLLAPLLPRPWERPTPGGRDLFTLLIGLTVAVNGGYLVFMPDEFRAPIFDLVRPSLPLYGLGFMIGGLAVVATQLRPSLPRRVAWGAHLILAGAMLSYFARGPLPYASWTGSAYYGGFGVVVALLPWLGSRLHRFDPSSLRMQFALALVGAGVLPLLAGVALITDREERAVTARELDLQHSQAVALADDVARYLALHEGVVTAVAAQPDLASLAPEARQEILHGIGRAYGDTLFFVAVDAEGQPITEGVDGDGTAPFVFRAPVHDPNGRLVGLVVSVLDPTRLVDLLAGASLESGSKAYIVDGRGRLIADADVPPRAALSDLSGDPAVAALLASNDPSGSRLHASRGDDQLIGYARVPNVAWSVAVGRPARVALANVRAGRDLASLSLVLVISVTAALGVTVARRLARPLGVLTNAVKKLAAGDAAAPLPRSRLTEIAHLSSTFAEMRDRLAARTAERELALARETVLRRAGAALVAAADRQSIYQAAVESALALAGRVGDVRASLAIGSAETMTIVAVAGDRSGDSLGAQLDMRRLPGPVRPEGHQQRYTGTGLDPTALERAMGFRPKLREMVITPLLIRGETRGALVVASDSDLAKGCTEGLATLGAEVALALESAALTEDLLLRRGEARFRSLVQNSSDVIMIVDADGAVQFLSPSGERVLGYGSTDVDGAYLHHLIHPDDALLVPTFIAAAKDQPEVPRRVEWRVRHRNGSWLYMETIATGLLHDPDVHGIVLNSRDVGERRALEDQLKHQAFHDPLTKLPNRALLMDRLEHAVARASRNDASVAVLFLDLDNFKVINDSLGHQAGDALLVAVAERLRLCLRPADTAARVGGDEFTILLEDVTDVSRAIDVVTRIQERLQAPFNLAGREVFTAASIGVAFSRPDRDRPESLLRDADVALYWAKAHGKARHAVFDQSMDARALERLELETDLRHAVERGEFRVHYQPIINLATGRVCEFEALVRWQHPRRGLVLPLEFIPLAEETGLIVPIGQWVLEEACRQLKAWQAALPGEHPLAVSVNLSARQFQHPTLVADIARVLRDSGLDPRTLRLEITESVVMEDAESTTVTLEALKSLGIELVIDDFGTGYSSLSYLSRFSIDGLKIDRSFVAKLGKSPHDTAIVEGIMALSTSLMLGVTAEGIETVEQLEQLRLLGCDRGQGYYFMKPLPSEAVPSALAACFSRSSLGELAPPRSSSCLSHDAA